MRDLFAQADTSEGSVDAEVGVEILPFQTVPPKGAEYTVGGCKGHPLTDFVYYI